VDGHAQDTVDNLRKIITGRRTVSEKDWHWHLGFRVMDLTRFSMRLKNGTLSRVD
jgi:hypothetical protein